MGVKVRGPFHLLEMFFPFSFPGTCSRPPLTRTEEAGGSLWEEHQRREQRDGDLTLGACLTKSRFPGHSPQDSDPISLGWVPELSQGAGDRRLEKRGRRAYEYVLCCFPWWV